MSDSLYIEREADRIALVGELDLAAAPNLLRELAGIDGAAVTVDLAGVTFLDSSGIKALMKVRRDHAGVRVIGANENVRSVLRVAGLVQVLLDD